jgi:hypothetical protein
MEVYLVYYDNGCSYEDHHTYVDKVFGSKESADKYAEEKNAPMQKYTPSVTEERYVSENWGETTGYTYADFIENEHYEWSINVDARYFVAAMEVL